MLYTMYSKKAHIHFIGIGGIGMSGIAKILKHQGYHVSGCDIDLRKESVLELTQLGCPISNEHNGIICQDESIDIVVYSSAVQAHSPEIIAAQQRGIPTIPRALMLAELMRTKYSIAIAGSHGKTTTTSIISHILIETGLNPTVIIGGHLQSINTNAQLGCGDFLVAEADESDRSLLHLHATLAVVTNIDLEHLETYRDIEDIKDTFKKFLNNLPFYGTAVLCLDDPHVRSILPIQHLKTITYGVEKIYGTYQTDVWADDIILDAAQSTFTVWHKKSTAPLGTVTIHMPGRHNVLNAVGALAMTHALGVPFEAAAQALATFSGVKRRFSYNGEFKGAEVFDDYGHHPNEIIQTLAVARKRAKGRLHVVFQPHRYTRTNALWHSFVDVFVRSPIDRLIITDIYPASETPIAHITSTRLVKEIKELNPGCNVSYTPYESSFERIITKLEQDIQPGDLILLLGAGKINQIADLIV